MEVPKADLLGKYFVDKYYHDLFEEPHVLLQYYTSESCLMRVQAGPTGNAITARSQNEIERVVMSMERENCRAELLTVNTLDSFNACVFILVTGAIHKGNIAKKFVHSFFLYPSKGHYFVYSDIFKYLDEEKDSDGTYESLQSASTTGAIREASDFAPSAGVEEKLESSYPFREDVEGEQLVDTEEIIYHQMTEAFLLENLKPIEKLSLQDDVLPPFSQEGPVGKMSYAAILQLQSDSHTLNQTAVSSHQPALTPGQSSLQHNNSISQQPRANAPTKAKQEPIPVEVDLRSVFVTNLPAKIMNRQLEDEMKRFGPLRPNRVSLKTTKTSHTYAFVDFEESASAQAAIEASPILIGGQKVYIEKRTSVYRGDGKRGRGRR